MALKQFSSDDLEIPAYERRKGEWCGTPRLIDEKKGILQNGYKKFAFIME